MFFSVYERRRNESEKRRSRPRCTCSSEEINEHILAIPTCPARLRFSLSLSFRLASSIDIVARPPLHLFPLFVSDLNLRPGYQLAALLFALHHHRDLISVTVVTIGAVVIIFVFQPLLVFNMAISILYNISRSNQLPISRFKERFPYIETEILLKILFIDQ